MPLSPRFVAKKPMNKMLLVSPEAAGFLKGANVKSFDVELPENPDFLQRVGKRKRANGSFRDSPEYMRHQLSDKCVLLVV